MGLLFFVQLLMFDFLFSSYRHIKNYVPATLKKQHNAHPNITGKNKEHSLFIYIMSMVHHYSGSAFMILHKVLTNKC